MPSKRRGLEIAALLWYVWEEQDRSDNYVSILLQLGKGNRKDHK